MTNTGSNPNKNHQDKPGNPSVATSSEKRLNTRENAEPLRVLSEQDWQFWVQNGYVIIRNAISQEQAQKTADFLWEFEEKSIDNPDTWYKSARAEMQMQELVGSGMVEAYHHQTFWDNRQKKRVYGAFVDVWGTEKLWVSIDRANLNFPNKAGHNHKGFIHWDYDPETKPQNVQGVLALADQNDTQMGGFQCIPKLFREYDTWKLTQPKDRDRFKPDISGLEEDIVKVKLNAGDLMIFHSAQPHGIRANNSKDKVRISQYISMMPAEEHNKKMRDWRVRSWKERIAPEGYAFAGDPRKWEQTHYSRANLAPLGKKLLGLNDW